MQQNFLTEAERLAQIGEPLLAWYDRARRHLPWREQPTPYRVWISEMMLQQTRVEAALPYFERFVNELPDPAALAAADEERLLKLWEGLGYYSRVRNLKKAAQLVMQQHGGRLPASFEALRALPGLGDYAAGAIASIAFGLRVPAVDGNVLRVISRLLAFDGDVTLPAVKRRLTELVRGMLPETRVGDFNQALMELGAVLCLPNGAPICESCPVCDLCEGFRRGCAAELPNKTEKKPRTVQQMTVLCFTDTKRVLLRRRPDKGLLAGMWELPWLEGWSDASAVAALADSWGVAVRALEPLSAAKHIFTHIEWRMQGWRIFCEACAPLPPGWAWADAAALEHQFALPSAFGPMLRQLSL